MGEVGKMGEGGKKQMRRIHPQVPNSTLLYFVRFSAMCRVHTHMHTHTHGRGDVQKAVDV